MPKKGFCECGCGGLTSLATVTSKRFGWIKGEPLRYIKGHYKPGFGKEAAHWKGGIKKHDGYILVQCPNHPRANSQGYVREHVLIAEKALGKLLPDKAVVHHANGSRDNGPLIICQDANYHKLLHQRMKAYEACGHANWLKCWICQKYDSPDNLVGKSMSIKAAQENIMLLID